MMVQTGQQKAVGATSVDRVQRQWGSAANQSKRRGEATRRVFGLKKQRVVVSDGRCRRCGAAVRDGGALPVLLRGGGGWQRREQIERERERHSREGEREERIGEMPEQL